MAWPLSCGGNMEVPIIPKPWQEAPSSSFDHQSWISPIVVHQRAHHNAIHWSKGCMETLITSPPWNEVPLSSFDHQLWSSSIVFHQRAYQSLICQAASTWHSCFGSDITWWECKATHSLHKPKWGSNPKPRLYGIQSLYFLLMWDFDLRSQLKFWVIKLLDSFWSHCGWNSTL